MRGSDSSVNRQVSPIGAGKVIASSTVSGNLVTQIVTMASEDNEVVGLYIK